MICKFCGGHVVWKGLGSISPYTECWNCNKKNCQIVYDGEEPEEEQEDDSYPDEP